MSAPRSRTRPATPRNDAADRYSPAMAEALSPGGTTREATKKSLVVRETRRPKAPMPRVATDTASTAPRAHPFTRWSPVAHQLAERPLVALGPDDVEPGQQDQERVDQNTQQPPRQRNAEKGRTPRRGRAREQHWQQPQREDQDRGHAQGQPQLAPDEGPDVHLTELCLGVDLGDHAAGRRRSPGPAGDPDPGRDVPIAHVRPRPCGPCAADPAARASAGG